MKQIDNYIKMISFNDYIIEKLKIGKDVNLIEQIPLKENEDVIVVQLSMKDELPFIAVNRGYVTYIGITEKSSLLKYDSYQLNKSFAIRDIFVNSHGYIEKQSNDLDVIKLYLNVEDGLSIIPEIEDAFVKGSFKNFKFERWFNFKVDDKVKEECYFTKQAYDKMMEIKKKVKQHAKNK